VDEAAARQRLEQLLTDLDSSSRTLAGEHGDTGELSNLDQHPAEAASELTELDRDEAMRAVVEGQRQEVLAALERLDAGSYGRCVDCGTALPEERLDARPEAARCVSCQQDLEIAR
jgi:RNA polymerase-binding transcription factor DksA